jgi:hypothetical protein
LDELQQATRTMAKWKDLRFVQSSCRLFSGCIPGKIRLEGERGQKVSGPGKLASGTHL